VPKFLCEKQKSLKEFGDPRRVSEEAGLIEARLVEITRFAGEDSDAPPGGLEWDRWQFFKHVFLGAMDVIKETFCRNQ
jgi:hypothetical protein